MGIVVFMAAQPSKDGRLGDSPQNSYAGRLPSKRFVQGIAAFHQCSILPEVGELMVNTQQYDSHEGRFHHSFAREFHGCLLHPVLTWRGGEGTVG